MKPLNTIAIFLITLIGFPMAGKLNIVASIPDLGDLARIIGEGKVKVKVLATGREDLHAVPVRPSFIPILNRADLLITLGLDAEHAWLPALAAESRNASIMEDREGWIEVFKGIEIKEVPKIIDRSEGEQHPEGNPHINIGPQNGAAMAKNIALSLIRANPDNKTLYQNRLEQYIVQLREMEGELRENGKALQGVKIAAYHPDVVYLCHFYGMERVGTIEPKAGIQPTARHIAQLAENMKQSGVKLILYSQAQNARIPTKLAKTTGAVTVEFANAVGAKKEIKSWIELQKYNLEVLLEGLKKFKPTKRAD